LLSFSIYYILYRNLCQKKEEKSIIDRINRYSDLLNRLHPESCLVWCGEWPAGRIEPNRRLYDYELVYVAGGKGYVATGEESHYCEAGSLLVIPPGVVHFSRAETRIRRWCIHFDWYGECLAQRELEHPYLFLDDEAAYREELAAAQSFEQVVTHVYHTNRIALAMFESAGFTQIGPPKGGNIFLRKRYMRSPFLA